MLQHFQLLVIISSGLLLSQFPIPIPAKATIVEWKPYKHDFAVNLIGDGGTDIFNTLKESGEPAIPNFKDLINPSLPKVDMNEL
jgi:hypothetical protein